MDEAIKEARILIVDDESAVRTVLRKILERQGYRVMEAEDGLEGLKIVEEIKFNLVISDVYMPAFSGIDLLAEIKKRYPRLPVIIVTGKASVEAAVECMKIGAADYISKPFKLTQIEESVKKVLEYSLNQSDEKDETTLIHDCPSFLTGYEVLDTLGEGNMGIVYLVQRKIRGKNKQFAIKIFKSNEFSADDNKRLRKRFLHEAKAASTVKHPNIVKIIEFGLDENALVSYIVMEYIRGVSLKHFMTSPDQLDYLRKCKLLRQMADALTAIHRMDICHRDIKPANILVDEKMCVKITDFGIAKLPDSMLTQQSELMGSPGYMAPEAFLTPHVDRRADIFSMGVIAYELLLGQHPFNAESSVQMCYLIRNEEPPDPLEIDPSFPIELKQMLDKMLMKKAEDRYDQAEDVSKEFRKYIYAQSRAK